MVSVTRLLICHFLIIIPNIQPQPSVVNTLQRILFTLTKNKQGNKSILTRSLVGNQWSTDFPLLILLVKESQI